MEKSMMRAEIHELEEQTIARFLNGLNAPICKIVDFQPYRNMTELLHQATKAERHVKMEEQNNKKTRAYFASRNASASATPMGKPALANPKVPPKNTSKQQVNSTMAPKDAASSSKIVCFKCGGKGHKSFECINTKTMLTDEYR